MNATRTPARTLAVSLFAGALGVVGLTACSSGASTVPETTAAATPTQTATPTDSLMDTATDAASGAAGDATDAADSARAAASSAAAAVSERADINSASTEEIAATLRENGVPDADRWAGEIDRLRKTDPNTVTTRLQQEAERAGINQETVQNLLGSLRF